jgi:hypothetical protein
MWYVYELSFKGYVFYVGCTNSPLRRYKQHYSHGSACINVTTLLMHTNQLADFNIIYHNRREIFAAVFERQRIMHYIEQRHKLCNNMFNHEGNRLQIIAHKFEYPYPRLRNNFAHEVEQYINNYNQINNIKNETKKQRIQNH